MKILLLLTTATLLISCVTTVYASSYTELKQQADDLYEEDKYSAANNLYRKSFEQVPNRRELITNLAALAVSEHKINNSKSSSGFLKRIINIYPNSKFARDFSRKTKLKITKKTSSVHNKDTFSKHMQAGDGYYENKLYNQSVVSYLKALSLANSKNEITKSLASLIPSSKCSSDKSSAKTYITRLKKYQSHKSWAIAQSKIKAKCEKPNSIVKTEIKQCSSKPKYSCDSTDQKTVVKQMCREYFKACDYSKKLNTVEEKYNREMNCLEVTDKLFGEGRNMEHRVKQALAELSGNNIDTESQKSAADSLIADFINLTKNTTQKELFYRCNELASQACSTRLNEWKSECGT